MTPEVQSLNTALARRRGESQPIGAPLSVTWWEDLGAQTYRLKNFKTLDVIGSIRRVKSFSGYRTVAARVSGEMQEFASTFDAAKWVESAEVKS